MYNEGSIIEDAVKTFSEFLASAFENWELIFVDDGSVDVVLPLWRRLLKHSHVFVCVLTHRTAERVMRCVPECLQRREILFCLRTATTLTGRMHWEGLQLLFQHLMRILSLVREICRKMDMRDIPCYEKSHQRLIFG